MHKKSGLNIQSSTQNYYQFQNHFLPKTATSQSYRQQQQQNLMEEYLLLKKKQSNSSLAKKLGNSTQNKIHSNSSKNSSSNLNLNLKEGSGSAKTPKISSSQSSLQQQQNQAINKYKYGFLSPNNGGSVKNVKNGKISYNAGNNLNNLNNQNGNSDLNNNNNNGYQQYQQYQQTDFKKYFLSSKKENQGVPQRSNSGAKIPASQNNNKIHNNSLNNKNKNKNARVNNYFDQEGSQNQKNSQIQNSISSSQIFQIVQKQKEQQKENGNYQQQQQQQQQQLQVRQNSSQKLKKQSFEQNYNGREKEENQNDNGKNNNSNSSKDWKQNYLMNLKEYQNSQKQQFQKSQQFQIQQQQQQQQNSIKQSGLSKQSSFNKSGYNLQYSNANKDDIINNQNGKQTQNQSSGNIKNYVTNVGRGDNLMGQLVQFNSPRSQNGQLKNLFKVSQNATPSNSQQGYLLQNQNQKNSKNMNTQQQQQQQQRPETPKETSLLQKQQILMGLEKIKNNSTKNSTRKNFNFPTHNKSNSYSLTSASLIKNGLNNNNYIYQKDSQAEKDKENYLSQSKKKVKFSQLQLNQQVQRNKSSGDALTEAQNKNQEQTQNNQKKYDLNTNYIKQKSLQKQQNDQQIQQNQQNQQVAQNNQNNQNQQNNQNNQNNQQQKSQVNHKKHQNYSVSYSQKQKSLLANSENFVYYMTSLQESFSVPQKQDYFSQLSREHFVQTCQGILYSNLAKPQNPKDLSEKKVYLKQRSQHHLKTIVFDLDETLIHCNENVNMPHDVKLSIKFPQGEVIEAGINVRPYAREILRELSKEYEIVIFTASHQCYAMAVIDHLDPKKEFIHHRFFREHCIQTPQGVYIKDLRIFADRKLEDLVLVDNAAYSFSFQIDNGIPIIPFYHHKEDMELISLVNMLKPIKNFRDVREYLKNMFKFKIFNDPEGPGKVFENLFNMGN